MRRIRFLSLLLIFLLAKISQSSVKLEIHYWDCLGYFPALPSPLVTLTTSQTQFFYFDLSTQYFDEYITYLWYAGIFLHQFSGSANLYLKPVFSNLNDFSHYQNLSVEEKETYVQNLFDSTPLAEYDSKTECNFLEPTTDKCNIVVIEPYNKGSFNQLFLFAIESTSDETSFETIFQAETSAYSKEGCISLVRFYKSISTIIIFGVIISLWFLTFSFVLIMCGLMLVLYFLKGRITMEKTKQFYTNMFGTTTNQTILLHEEST